MNETLKKVKKVGKILGYYTLVPGHITMYLLRNEETRTDTPILNWLFGGTIMNLLGTGIISLGIWGYEEAFPNKRFDIPGEDSSNKIEIGFNNEYKNNRELIKDYGFWKTTLLPQTYIYDKIAQPAVTIIDGHYTIEGNDIIQYDPSTGYLLNKKALTERNFQVGDDLYLQEDISKEYFEYKEGLEKLQLNINEAANDGDFSKTMILGTDFMLEHNRLEKEYNKIEKAKANMIRDLDNIVNTLNKEFYEMRTKLNQTGLQ